jgi:O-antigen/teichoic acid export membrane protein
MLKRILKTTAALGIGQFIHIAGQLGMPPVFIAAYGVEGFAFWLSLTAVTAHLTMLDFGLQTYVVNELTILHHRGETMRFRQLQSVGFRLSLLLAGFGLAVAASVFLLPLEEWLGPEYGQSAQSICSLLALQIIATILFGQFAGLYRVMGRPETGVVWQNWHRTISIVSTLCLAAARAPLWLIAAAQALVITAILIALITTLKRRASEVFPRLDFWNREDAWCVLRGSAFFGLFGLNQVLVFQMPVLLLTRFGSASAVVMFSIGRTLFSFVRQLCNLLMAALAPELTRLQGLRDTMALAKMYRCVESIAYTTALVGGISLFVAAPTLLKYWVGRPDLFNLTTFWLLMLASIAMLVKETKLYFQHATNEHVPSAITTSVTYAGMLIAAIPCVRAWGVNGLIGVWLASEVAQAFLIQRFNARLIGKRTITTVLPLIRFALATAIIASALWLLEPLLRSGSIGLQGFKALVVVGVVAALSCYVFDLGHVLRHARLGALLRPIPSIRQLT